MTNQGGCFFPAGGRDIVDKTLEALLSAAADRQTTRPSQSNLEKFELPLLTLEILCLARSVLDVDGTRSWFATDELEWLTSRDHVHF
jgi:hypothetical protein